jgi:hypothetical protein
MKHTLHELTSTKETAVEQLWDDSPLGDRILFGEIVLPISSHERPGLGWPGRFWLPADGQVQPTGKSCLSRSFGQAGEQSWMVSSPAPGAESQAVYRNLGSES